MRSFAEITAEKAGTLFRELGSRPELIGFVTNGVPQAMSAYLMSKMALEAETNTAVETVSLEFRNSKGILCNFRLRVIRKGDAIAFSPEFEMGDYGQKLINADSIDVGRDDYAFTGAYMKSKDTDEPKLFSYFDSAFRGMIFNGKEWIDSNRNGVEEKGVSFEDTTDCATMVSIVIFSIFEILSEYKDSVNEIEYPIDGLGKFKVTPVHNSYEVTLSFDKSFKSNCKNDELATKLATN